VVEVARVPGTSYFADLTRHPDHQRVPDVLVFRSEGALLYFNVDHVRDRLTAILAERATPPRLVVFFCGQIPVIDLAGAELLIDLRVKCLAQGIEFRLAEVRGAVREALLRVGEAHGAELAEAHQTVDDVVERWRASVAHPIPATV
jgi:MFS superfamily sulfate permease-like transporter